MTEKERMLAGKIYCPFKVGGQYVGKEPRSSGTVKKYFRTSGGRCCNRAAVLLR